MTDAPATEPTDQAGSDQEPRAEGAGASGWAAIAVALAAVALIVAMAGVAFAMRAIDEADDEPEQAAAGGSVTVDVSMTEFSYDPSFVEVPAGTEVIVNLTNDGVMPHDLKTDGETGSELLDPGQTETVSLGTFDESSLAWCTVAGHRESGMEFDIVVTGGGSEPQSVAGPGFEAEDAHEVTIDNIALDATSMPDSANYTFYEDGVASKPVERNGPIDIEAHFSIAEGTAEMLEGTTLDFWTFNGAIPGPMIRARVGDNLDFSLHNPTDSEIPHNVDFHAVTGPGGGAVTLDASPGATSNLEVKLQEPGVFLYHCAFPDVPTHLSHGMYGLIIVEPEEGLPPVDHEFYVMQSEFYTEAGGTETTDTLTGAGHLDFSGSYARSEDPTFMVFNGKPGALTGEGALGADGSIEAGDTVRLFVGNAGPNLISSFHVIGEILDRVYVEGSFGLVNTNVQTTLVPAGGAVAVEFTVDVPGDYLLVDHALFRTHKGLAGILTATGDERPDLYNPKSFSTDARGGEAEGGGEHEGDHEGEEDAEGEAEGEAEADGQADGDG
jgi:nitrite reductase (NO-forming)